MRTSPAVPSGYVIALLGGVMLVAREASHAAACSMIASAGSLRSYAEAHGVGLIGRGRATAHRVAAAEADWVVRQYTRGGSIARILRDRYVRIGRFRPLRELAVSVEARRRDVRTPAVEAVCILPAGIFYRADIATGFIADAADLGTLLLRGEADDTAAWQAAGELLRDAFAAGVVHPDLNLGNVLIQSTAMGTCAHLLDLDRARVVRRLSARQRARMLARFARSHAKLERFAGRATPAACLAAFTAAVHP